MPERFIVAVMTVFFATACAYGERPLRIRDRLPFEQSELLGPDSSEAVNGANAVDRSGEDVSGLSRSALWAHWNTLRGDPYALDGIERFLEGDPRSVECTDDTMLEYAGTTVRYAGPVKVSLPFLERLMRFEEVLSQVGTETYGRPPKRIRHLGAFSCRVSRTRSYRLSEHALGNAIDIAGFDFGALTKDQPLPQGLPRQLAGPFQVRVVQHWSAPTDGVRAVHGRFLRLLAARLLDRKDIFRVALGPSHRGHHDHLHFDVSPWRYVDL